MKYPISALNAFFKRNKQSKGIISVWGDFGVGKTTFVLQTVINSVYLRNKILFIYTKPNFPIEKINKIFGVYDDTHENLTFIQPINYDDLHKIVYNLEFLILSRINDQHTQYSLIVIDSVTDLYRLELNNRKKEKNYELNYILNQILANLFFIHNKYNIEILIVNEKASKQEENQIIEIQSGGNVIEYWVSTDIKIERTEILNQRKFTVSNRPEIFNKEFFSELTETGFH